MALLVYFLGRELIENLLPPIVTGPIIMVIGLNLAPAAIKNASQNWTVALIVLTTVILVSVYGKGFFKLIPVLVGLIVGYVMSLILGIVDLKPVQEAALFAIPAFTKPEFNPVAIGLIAPVAMATIVEHVGDVLSVGATVQKDFIKDPGFIGH